ncbi:MAG TPA: hypothetical protein VER17_07625 [Tepidisphaeraceae bacterium]|nr:hypothetical protein [Tepidisphaeraceae bacterium]
MRSVDERRLQPVAFNAFGVRGAKRGAVAAAGNLTIKNPLTDMELPGQYENPEYERQPLTVKQFQKLMKYHDTFVRVQKPEGGLDRLRPKAHLPDGAQHRLPRS